MSSDAKAALSQSGAAVVKPPNIEEYPSPPLDFAFQEIKTWEELLDHPPTGNTYSGPGMARPLLPGESVRKKEDDKEKDKKQKNDEPFWGVKKSTYGFSSYSGSATAASGPVSVAHGHGPVAPITIITAQQLAAQQNSGPATVQMPVVNVLRVNNNELSGWTECLPSLQLLCWQPTVNLHWIDLSHNRLSGVDSCLLSLVNLQVLYLHGNAITDINELTKLSALKQLTKLSAHGNELITTHPDTKQKSVARLEDTPFYRSRLIYTLSISQATNLKQLDFSAVTPRDRQFAVVWFKNHSKRVYPKKSVPGTPTGGPAGRTLPSALVRTPSPTKSPAKSSTPKY